MFQKFFLNFWIWWYLIHIREVGKAFLRMWLYILGYLNVVPMAKNLFVPLYQDRSWAGRAMSGIIRSIWVIGGVAIQTIITVPVVIIYIVYIFLPVLPIFMMFTFVL